MLVQMGRGSHNIPEYDAYNQLDMTDKTTKYILYQTVTHFEKCRLFHYSV